MIAWVSVTETRFGDSDQLPVCAVTDALGSTGIIERRKAVASKPKILEYRLRQSSFGKEIARSPLVMKSGCRDRFA